MDTFGQVDNDDDNSQLTFNGLAIIWLSGAYIV